MQQYLDLLNHELETGTVKSDRTGTGTISTFGYQLRFNLQDGFPILTTKKLHLRSIIYELLWFLNGDTNIKYLNYNRVTIWDECADSNRSIGRAYGAQWRTWRTADALYAHLSDPYRSSKTTINPRTISASSTHSQ